MTGHTCDPHCLGCCPGGCGNPSHEPPIDSTAWHGMGLWSPPSMGPGPNSHPQRMPTDPDDRPRRAQPFGGPSRW